MSTLNWGKLFSQGRCKAPCVPWTDEENKAIHEFKIPVDYVRDGILTLKDYQKALEEEASTGKKPLARMDRKDLIEKAKELGIKMTPEVGKDVLVAEITQRLELKKKKADTQADVKKAYDKESKFQAKQAASAKAEKDKAGEEAVKAGLQAPSGLTAEEQEKEREEKAKADAKAIEAGEKKLKDEADAKAKADSDAQKEIEDNNAKRAKEDEEKAKAEADAKAKADKEAKEAEKKAKAEADKEAKEAEKKAKAEADKKAKEAEAKAKKDAKKNSKPNNKKGNNK